MDDHGNQALVAEFQDPEEAARRLHELESRGHKQTYWLEAGAPSSQSEGGLHGQADRQRTDL